MTKYYFNLPPTSSHLHPLQVNNSRLVEDEDDDGEFMLEKLLSYVQNLGIRDAK